MKITIIKPNLYMYPTVNNYNKTNIVYVTDFNNYNKTYIESKSIFILNIIIFTTLLSKIDIFL